MDKHLNDNEERLFDLVDQKEFDQLTTEEKAFVEAHFSQAEYRLQRQMIRESENLFEPVSETPSLVISGSSFTGKTIPLYQALIGIAATVVLFISIWPNQTETPQLPNNKPALSKTDTVIQTQIIRDTIIRYKNYRNGNQLARSEQPNKQVLATQMRLLEATNSDPLPDIVSEMNRPAGSSLKDDPAAERLLKSTYRSDAK
ncbi:MAG: hypothetical protein QE487_10095 [Fluviicola sp.]|nr:hypothetical protein [Fluviicola sp.]